MEVHASIFFVAVVVDIFLLLPFKIVIVIDMSDVSINTYYRAGFFKAQTLHGKLKGFRMI